MDSPVKRARLAPRLDPALMKLLDAAEKVGYALEGAASGERPILLAELAARCTTLAGACSAVALLNHNALQSDDEPVVVGRQLHSFQYVPPAVPDTPEGLEET